MRLLLVFFLFLGFPAFAGTEFETALTNVRKSCSGISNSMSELKTMAGINTAVTGVGTATGAGATATGLVKASKDKEIEELKVELKQLREIEGSLSGVETQSPDEFERAFENLKDIAKEELKNYETEIAKLEKQSKNLGNWRTGLLAGSTATNVAGAVIAGTNQTDTDLKTRIKNCLDSVQQLQSTIGQAMMDGKNVNQAQNIVRACSEYERIDLSKIDNRAKGAMISSIIGSASGLSGTVTSAFANSKDIRNNDDNAKKEKDLNTASNILAGTTTAASATATVFNASQISAIKKIVQIAENCEKEVNK